MIQWLADGIITWVDDDNDERQKSYEGTEVQDDETRKINSQ